MDGLLHFFLAQWLFYMQVEFVIKSSGRELNTVSLHNEKYIIAWTWFLNYIRIDATKNILDPHVSRS